MCDAAFANMRRRDKLQWIDRTVDRLFPRGSRKEETVSQESTPRRWDERLYELSDEGLDFVERLIRLLRDPTLPTGDGQPLPQLPSDHPPATPQDSEQSSEHVRPAEHLHLLPPPGDSQRAE